MPDLKKKFRNVFSVTGAGEKAVLGNMMKLAGGDGISRIIGIAVMPVITRIYLPEDIGVLSVFVAIVAILSPLATFRYSLAVPLPKRIDHALNIAALSAAILVLSGFAITLLFQLFGAGLLVLLSMEAMIPYWYLVPVAVIGAGIYEILSNWAVREKAFTQLARTKVWQKTIGSVAKVGLGLMGLKPQGLLIGHVLTQAGGIVTLFRVFWSSVSTHASSITFADMKYAAARYIDFPKYRMPSQILLLLASKLVLFYFAWQFGADTAGHIGLALMMVMLPVTLFGYTTGKAYYAEIAGMGKENAADIYALTIQIVKKLLLVSILPFAVLFIAGPWLFEFAFGSGWTESGQFARILSVYLLVQFIYAPVSEGIFNVFEKQKLVLLIETGRLMLTLLAFGISWYAGWSAEGALWAYSILISVNYALASVVIFRIIKKAAG